MIDITSFPGKDVVSFRSRMLLYRTDVGVTSNFIIGCKIHEGGFDCKVNISSDIISNALLKYG